MNILPDIWELIQKNILDFSYEGLHGDESHHLTPRSPSFPLHANPAENYFENDSWMFKQTGLPQISKHDSAVVTHTATGWMHHHAQLTVT